MKYIIYMDVFFMVNLIMDTIVLKLAAFFINPHTTFIKCVAGGTVGTMLSCLCLLLPYENMVADYIKETNNHVLYRVTPVFEGNNLVATGVQMEAKSVEDNGEGIEFNVFVYNVQPGITIDYATGNSALSGEEVPNNTTSNNPSSNTTTSNITSVNKETIVRGNSKSKIYHLPGQKDYENMSDSKYLVNFNSEQEAIAAGYRKASR